VSATEDALRTELRGLAALPQGRDLLQLALRGLSGDGRGLTAGCWVKGGGAGCLFQHAYWQGVEEGAFADDGRARAWVTGVAGPHYTAGVRWGGNLRQRLYAAAQELVIDRMGWFLRGKWFWLAGGAGLARLS